MSNKDLVVTQEQLVSAAEDLRKVSEQFRAMTADEIITKMTVEVEESDRTGTPLEGKPVPYIVLARLILEKSMIEGKRRQASRGNN